MPDGLLNLKTEINLKLENIKILTNHKKIQDLVDELMLEDLPKLYELLEEKK